MIAIRMLTLRYTARAYRPCSPFDALCLLTCLTFPFLIVIPLDDVMVLLPKSELALVESYRSFSPQFESLNIPYLSNSPAHRNTQGAQKEPTKDHGTDSFSGNDIFKDKTRST